ncbi:MAG TPA: PEP/pyruvate-binding domain-containing protein, partial [Draconibacterium sp.]|nr:PEP/pyruvate-binding domain-containing protein [Draconibacterium sp.]
MENMSYSNNQDAQPSGDIIYFNKQEIITGLIKILANQKDFDEAVTNVCNTTSEACHPAGLVHTRVSFENRFFTDNGFTETNDWVKEDFLLPNDKKCIIEVFLRPLINSPITPEILKEADEALNIVVPILNGILSKFQLRKVSFDIGERQKELKSIKQAADILKESKSIDELLQEVCSILPEAMQFPLQAMARITFENKSYSSEGFLETPFNIGQTFETPDGGHGAIEIFYKEIPVPYGEKIFLDEEQNLVENLASLIAGSVSKNALQKLLQQNAERLKELKGINQTSAILEKSKTLEEALQEIARILPESWQYPDDTAVRIKYNKRIFTSRYFEETPWVIQHFFELPGKKKGIIEVFYLREFPMEFEGPFLKEEYELLRNIAGLISGSVTRNIFNKLKNENIERLKELKAINQTSKIIEDGKPVDETFQEICSLLPKSWQYPKFTVARIIFEGKSYISKEFQETKWVQAENFVTIDNKRGIIEIFYLREFPREDEGPFLHEERNLLINISKLIAGYLNNYKGRGIIHLKGVPLQEIHPTDAFRNSMVRNKKPLQLYFNQQSIDKYIYLDMMRYKIKHILFVSTLYDAFTLESEDSFFARFMGEIYQYSLFSTPRITGASTAEEALELLETTPFNLVILMAGVDREAPIQLSEQIRDKHENLPIYLLLNKKSDIKHYEELVPTIRSVDKLFVWSGDSLILFAIVKLTEDKVNVENDTRVGLVRVILLIEDSPDYYSKYLQILYDIIFSHINQLLPEVEKNELDKISRMRSRPKILLARNYEEATAIFNKYHDFMLCVISDMEFERAGKLDKNAGVKFVKYVKSHISKLPIVLQSSENSNERVARELDVNFINKNSETLLNELKHFLNNYLGFGHFVFRNRKGEKIGVAKTLREFETLLKEVPDESLELHASENQLSLWLMQRGEIQLARTLNPLSINMFNTIGETRQHLLQTIGTHRKEKKKGKILTFNETAIIDEKNIVSFAGGALGGKGRGLAFINTLIYNIEFPQLADLINITTPITVIIGTDEFQHFITKNKLFDKVVDSGTSYQRLRELFVAGQLSGPLVKKLKLFVSQIDKPIVARSSSNSEDSITQPFAGVFDTYIVPNNTNKKLVLEQVSNAIKLVFASAFSPKARNFLSVIHHKIEEEKMAVVLQELVGNQYGNYYYPHISGVAQSFNYYPVASMKPEEGVSVVAFGLGTYVVDGWKSFRFSPKYPLISNYSLKDLLDNSQVQFYAVDCEKTDIDFLKDGELAALKLLEICDAMPHGTLKHCVSVYNQNNDRLEPGDTGFGPLVVNFANILNYNYIPLAKTISTILSTVQEAFGSPVEIEYAVNLDRSKNGLPSFYLLQIKPLVGEYLGKKIDLEKIDKSKMMLYTRSSVGNGQIENIRDIIYVDIAKFNKLKTLEMADEIESLNKIMIENKRPYILIGPGRWGSRD